MNTFCTIVNSGYLAQAQALIHSFRKQHPDDRFVTLVFDLNVEKPDLLEGSEVWRLEDLDIELSILTRMQMFYDVVEFATSLKPILLNQLLNHSETATYIDPDILLFSRLDFAVECARKSGIALTPHRLTPFKGPYADLLESSFLKYGAFNLGFISVSASGIQMLQWWEKRLMFGSTRFPNSYIFTDQKWVDLVPSFFEHKVIKHLGYNVAPWNIDERQLRSAEGHLFAGNEPLVFIHFSQMSNLLAKGIIPNYWEANLSSEKDKQSLDLIDGITRNYSKDLNQMRLILQKKSSSIFAPRQRTLAWTTRENIINDFRDKGTFRSRFFKNSQIGDGLIKFIMRSSSLVGMRQGLRDDIRRVRNRFCK